MSGPLSQEEEESSGYASRPSQTDCTHLRDFQCGSHRTSSLERVRRTCSELEEQVQLGTGLKEIGDHSRANTKDDVGLLAISLKTMVREEVRGIDDTCRR